MSGYCLPWAAVDWATPLTPRSPDHDDIYWSRDQGLSEKHHVFINGNHLEARFARLGSAHFTVAEVGFGFGLNFLLTVQQWRISAPDGAKLNYVALERAPISPADLSVCFSRLGLHQADAATLIERLPLPVPGWHVVTIADDISLILGLGDANYLLDDMDAAVDCWFLDGFSPRVNADAWGEPVVSALSRLSRPGATASTYSVAGTVRRGIESAGFSIERAPGYGRKAEMLVASNSGEWAPNVFRKKRVGIIGAGIAGLSLARSLRRRQIDCTVFDRGAAPLAGASGAPAMSIYPQLSATPELSGQFSLTAFCFARHFYRTYANTGRCQLAESPDAVERFRQIAEQMPADFVSFLGAHDISRQLSIDCRYPGLFFPNAGFAIARAEFTDDMKFRGEQIVTACSGRSVETTAGSFQFDAVVIASGYEELPQTVPLGRVPVRGQNMTGRTKSPPSAVVGGPISVVPIDNGIVVVGGTYSQQDTDSRLRDSETLSLASKADRYLELEVEPESAWSGIRSSTRDRQPIVGPLPHWDQLGDWCESGSPAPFTGWNEGLFTMVGFGSHGATTAPLLAESLARQITGEAGCLGISGAVRLNPARFALRDAGRRRDLELLRNPPSGLRQQN